MSYEKIKKNDFNTEVTQDKKTKKLITALQGHENMKASIVKNKNKAI